jgi:histone deacetylase 1/2
MENSNSREYLEKITAAVIDNLRHTGPAPSVQMQDVPRKPFGGMTDEEEAELDDMDEDDNKDVRMTQHRWDKRVEHENEFEPSDDDEMARANGATRANGKRTFNDYRTGDKEDNSERASPAAATNGGAPEAPAAEESQDVNDDTIDDFAGDQEKMALDKEAEPNEPEKDKEAEKESEQEKDSDKEKDKVDDDGDVGMADDLEPQEEKPIKEEQVDEPEPAPERVPSKSPIAEEEPKESSKEKSEPAVDAPTEAAATAEAKTEAEAEVAPEAAVDTADAATEKPAAEEESKPSEAEPEKSPEASPDAKEKTEQPADAMEVDQEKDEAEPKKASTPPA